MIAFGPVGGIDAMVAVKWALIWTFVLGGMLYASLWCKPWPDTPPSHHHVDDHHHH